MTAPVDFMMGDGQVLLAERGFVEAGVSSPPTAVSGEADDEEGAPRD